MKNIFSTQERYGQNLHQFAAYAHISFGLKKKTSKIIAFFLDVPLGYESGPK